MRGILVGVDGSATSAPAIEFAFRLASFRERPLTVLHSSLAAVLRAPTGPATPCPIE